MQHWLTFWRSRSSRTGRKNGWLWVVTGTIVLLLFFVGLLLFRRDLALQFWNPTRPLAAVVNRSDQTATTRAIGLNPYPSWHSSERLSAQSVAWGDVDGDGDLDLAVGSSPVQLYLNDGRGLQTSADWSADEQGEATSLAWGDVDSDGDLDLAVTNKDAPTRVYLNDGGVLQVEARWYSSEEGGQSVAWGDMDGDRDFDLAVGYQAPLNADGPCCTTNIYLNEGGNLQSTAIWSAAAVAVVQSVAWGDVNGDGALDLAVGSSEPTTPTSLYLNNGGLLQTTAAWSPAEADVAQSVAFGDVDGDGDLDLAVGTVGVPNRLYLNNGGTLSASADWSSAETDSTQSVAWGDVDNDGDLDLAVGNGGFDPDRIYLNEEGMLAPEAGWSSNEQNDTQSVAWGDVDGDGDLDLAVGSQGAQNWVYTNQTGVLAPTAGWSSPDSDNTFSVAWGDLNEDGLLDLAAGNVEAPNRVYTAQADGSPLAASWSSIEKEDTQSVAWGDVNGDGALDLAFGNLGAVGRIHLNEEGHLQTAADWTPQKMYTTFSMAWGDMDGDGDLDLAVGNGGRIPNRVYRNEGGVLLTRPVWSAAEGRSTWQVAWGDVDNDGDLDLAVGNHGAPNELYLNDGGMLQARPAWSSVDSHQTTSLAWGDVDGDGDLDLAVGNQGAPNQLYANQEGALSTAAVWASNEADQTQSVAWGDVDSDGDLDLAVGNWDAPNRIYINEEGKLLPSAIWSATASEQTQSVAWGDADGDGDLDLAVGNWRGPNRIYFNRQPAYPFYPAGFYQMRINLQTQLVQGDDQQPATRTLAPANGYSIAHIRSGVIPITYRLFHPGGTPVRAVRAFYSLNGGGSWQPALPTAASQTTDLIPVGDEQWSDQLFLWDVAASRFSGHSDNVIFRLEALPNLRPLPNGVPGPYQRPQVATQTFPFRVRGAQVQVVDGVGQPVKGALVYYLPQNQTRNAQPIADRSGRPYHTDEQGYLQGRNLLVGPGDHLVALQAITATQRYTLYHTSAAPTLDGLAMFTVAESLAQRLAVTSAHPLLLFNLSIALEWDARKDLKYLTDLQLDLQRTSELLYDWTNGQAALGDITIYQNKEAWQSAAIRIYATNRLYPHAPVGGVVQEKLVEATAATQPLVYRPGQVAMPAVWNRYDRAGRNLGEDWARTLARALGQYLFFLQDNTIGADAEGAIKMLNDCPGVMRDPYTDVNSEYHPAADWLPGCAETFAQRQSGRYDWATISHFYPWLHEPTGAIDAVADAGPKVLPLALTTVRFVEPATTVRPVDLPAFTLVKAEGVDGNGAAYLAGHRARAFLFHNSEDDYSQLLDLGTPIYDQIQAWNARPNDTLCVYDLTGPTPVAGCNQVTASSSTFMLYQQRDWQPDVALVATSPARLTIKVANVRDNLTLQAQIYPLEPTEAISTPVTLPLTFDRNAGLYLGDLPMQEALMTAYVAIVDTVDPQRSIVTDYALTRGVIGNEPLLGISMDGQVLLYGVTKDAGAGNRENDFTLVQPATVIPSPPSWATVVGDTYRVTLAAAPTVVQPAIRINYPGYAIDDDKERLLRIHFWNGTAWRELPTTVDPAHNVTLAAAVGSGIYTLMVGIAPPLMGDGLNLTVYPLSTTTALSGTVAPWLGDPALPPDNGAACRVVTMLFCSR